MLLLNPPFLSFLTSTGLEPPSEKLTYTVKKVEETEENDLKKSGGERGERGQGKKTKGGAIW